MSHSEKGLYKRILNYRTVMKNLVIDRLYAINNNIRLKDIESKVFIYLKT